jgi:hypothetical protein
MRQDYTRDIPTWFVALTISPAAAVQRPPAS